MTKQELLDAIQEYNNPDHPDIIELIAQYGRKSWQDGYDTAVKEWAVSAFNPWRDDE